MSDFRITETELERTIRLDRITQYQDTYAKTHQLTYDLSGQELQYAYGLCTWLETKIAELTNII